MHGTPRTPHGDCRDAGHPPPRLSLPRTRSTAPAASRRARLASTPILGIWTTQLVVRSVMRPSVDRAWISEVRALLRPREPVTTGLAAASLP